MGRWIRSLRQLTNSWRFVMWVGSLMTATGVVLWGGSQSIIALASSSLASYGAVAAASVTNPPAPSTGASTFGPALLLMLGLAILGAGFYLRQSAAQRS